MDEEGLPVIDNPSSLDVALDLGVIGGEGLLTASTEVHSPRLTATQVRSCLFGDPPEIVASILDKVRIARDTQLPLDLGGLPSRIISIPEEMPALPIGLRPWGVTLAAWAKSTKGSKSNLPYKVTKDRFEHIKVTGPDLPEGYLPWFVSAGMDPGPQQTSRGHTSLLMIAAPRDWAPGLRETLRGPYGEFFVVRLDALVLRVPRSWWDYYAFGALEAGVLHFVAPIVPHQS